MIDAKKIASLIDNSASIHVNDEASREKYRESLVEAMGENKEEVKAFLINADANTFYMLDEVYEELAEKFGEEIDDIFANPQNYRRE